MQLDESKFNRLFLKNLFKEILKEKESYPITDYDIMCNILADAYLDEFGSGETPETIISKHGTVEKWLMKKVESLPT